jgi:Sec-independent protein secretion pathway component TatC
MSPKAIERITWVMIYGGLLVVGLAFAVHDVQPMLAWTLGIAGALETAIGIALIVVRSRMAERPPRAPGEQP